MKLLTRCWRQPPFLRNQKNKVYSGFSNMRVVCLKIGQKSLSFRRKGASGLCPGDTPCRVEIRRQLSFGFPTFFWPQKLAGFPTNTIGVLFRHGAVATIIYGGKKWVSKSAQNRNLIAGARVYDASSIKKIAIGSLFSTDSKHGCTRCDNEVLRWSR